VYEKLLAMVGYTPDEIRCQLPRIKKAFHKLGIDEEDIPIAEKRMESFFDLKLEGIRKMLRIFIEEAVALPLANEEKEAVLYAHFPPGPPDLFLAATMVSDRIYVGNPSEIIDFVLGAIFGKLDHILEAAEENGMIPGDAHCGRHQLLTGLYALKLIPVPDLSLSWSWFCDEATKADEFCHLRFHLPGRLMTIGRSMDNNVREEESPKRSFRYLTDEIRAAKKTLEDFIGRSISDDALYEAIHVKHRFWKSYFKICHLNGTAASQPLNITPLIYFWTIGNLSLREPQEAQNAIDLLYEELVERVNRGEGVVPAGAPRAMVPLVSLVDPGIVQMLEDQGIAIPYTEVNSVTSKRFWPETKDPCEEIASKFFKSPVSQSYRMRIDSVIEECRKWKIDGLFWYNHFSCRPTYTDSIMIVKAVKEELNIPAILIEGDAYDPRYYTKEQLRTRIEAFAEILKTTKSDR
jgi:hypothetical protein